MANKNKKGGNQTPRKTNGNKKSYDLINLNLSDLIYIRYTL